MEALAVGTSAPSQIPDKLYFRIGEVAQLAGIKPYVLRFWESEFTRLGPKKSDTGRRLYRRKDVELVLEIKQLLYEKRYTIAGARQFLASRESVARQRAAEKQRTAGRLPTLPAQGELFPLNPAYLQPVREGLNEILSLLDG